ncbi:hypothetical protein JSQ81_09715 [Sporosarcina sp. Marseille-Q4063]|uniref:hypothetical protein n=1 Tax=Sporosarcina sp. Marseille-Q4063 TaxID=2810514 RepID=UPI001BAFBA7F|nr:hypothetical protein [Sporosarcina sp. Marseille-Q4063]QUW23735.1 hypothetical protein JSQ81_09715 [Sporosarcina sp. Marseille-Q4063]
MLEDAWGKYESVIPRLEAFQPDEQAISDSMKELKQLFGCDEDISIAVLYYVGAFEGNAFVAPYSDGRLALCLSVETGGTDIALAHEMAHVVHSKTANLSMEWERSIASTVLQEGVAMRASQQIVPGYLDEAYSDHKPGWLETATSKGTAILNGMLPFLEDSSTEAVQRFIVGKGTTGIEREAYYAGWVLVESLLNEGVSFQEIASIPENQMPEYVRQNLEKLL